MKTPPGEDGGLLPKLLVLLAVIVMAVMQQVFPDKDCLDHPELYPNVSRAECLRNPAFK